MKKILIGVTLAIASLVVVAFFAWGWIGLNILAPLFLRPGEPFDRAAVDVLDYTDAANWAALPPRADESADLPGGYEPGSDEIAIFYVHPTAVERGRYWNLAPSVERANDDIRDYMLAGQASALRRVGAIYAPYYQQAGIFSSLPAAGDDGKASFDFAYENVAAAFAHFVDNHLGDRPFILAGHSQGTLHATRLLQEQIESTPLHDRLVAAYLVGSRVRVGDFTACSAPQDTGCVLSWNTVIEGNSLPDPLFEAFYLGDDGYEVASFRDIVCNPPAAGADGYTAYTPDAGLIPGVAGGQCSDGAWHIPDPGRIELTETQPTDGWLHVYDYAVPWEAIGADAQTRIDALAG